LADLLAYCCSHAAEMLSSHQHSVLCINSHQRRKSVACPVNCFFELYSSALMPWSDLHFYCRVLSYEGLWTHGNRKSCGPKETKQNPSASWTSSRCALWDRTYDGPWHLKYWVLSSVGVSVKEIQSNYKYCIINIISNWNMSVCQYWW